MDVLYGCDCDCGNHPNGAAATPVAYEVTRDGQRLKLCTRCDFSSDSDRLPLFDETTDSRPFADFDALGLFCMMGELSKQVKA